MNLKNLVMWVIIVLLSVGLFNMFQDPNKVNSNTDTLPFSNFLNEVEAGRVVEVQIQGNNISGILADGKTFKTFSPNYPELVDKLSSNGVSINATPQEDKMPSLLGILFVKRKPHSLHLDIWNVSRETVSSTQLNRCENFFDWQIGHFSIVFILLWFHVEP